MMRRLNPLTPEFTRFVVAGVCNTALTYVLYILLLRDMHYELAYSCAYIAGILFSYIMSSLFVFKTRPSKRTALRFPFVYLLQYIVGSVLLWLLVHQARVNEKAAMVLVIGVNVLLTYTLLRKLFKGRRQ